MKRETPFWRRYMRLWGGDARADIEDELTFHIESRVRELRARGLSESEARRQASVAFGDIARVREELRNMSDRRARAAKRTQWLRDLRLDLKLGYRLLARRRLFAAVVVATLALGIAASVTIYSLVHGVLLRPLPYPEGDRLVVLWEHNVPRANTENVVSADNFEAWRARSKSYTALAGLMPARFTVIGDTPERIYGGAVSPEWFDIVGVAPERGRGFTAEEARAGHVVVLSHELWARRYGSDSTIVGRTIELEGEAYAVLGVMPRGFDGPSFGWLDEQEFWVPFVPDENNRAWGRFLLVMGRLRAGVQLVDAQRELTSIAAGLATTNPKNRDWTADVVTLREQMTNELRTPLLVLLGAVALLQLIALVNVCALVVARAQERDLEFSVRAALGAGRRRLLRQLLAEALALVSIGAPLGILLALWLTGSLRPLLPADLPRLESIRFDGAVLAFGGGLALVTFCAVGIVPILRLVRASVEARLRESSGRMTRTRGSSAIVVTEIALALTLTVAAGLALRSFVELRGTHLGFVPAGLTSIRLTLARGYDSNESRALYFERVIEQLERVPGVEAVGAGAGRPLSEGYGTPSTAVQLADAPVEVPPVATIEWVTPDYFNALRTPVLEGRAHTAVDRADAPLTFVVSRDIARRLSPNTSIVGRRIVVALNRGVDARSQTIANGMEGEVVGVADEVRYGGLTEARSPAVYIAHAQWPREMMHVLVRSSLPLEVQLDALRAAIWSIDRTIPMHVEPLAAIVSQATAHDRVMMLILGLFSAIALLLAATGIYGVLAIEVGRRTRELGIRMSMGAQPASLRRLVLHRALRDALAGIALGSVLAFAATRSMRAMLHGISPGDPRTFATVALIMLVIALLAAFVPARRATRIDPLAAIRSE
jgi:putative ABC transport system permease protein